MGHISGKVWGLTQEIWRGPHSEIHLINAKKGGFCSKHIHEHKWNLFHVISGHLEVTIWPPSGTVDIVNLHDGESCQVPPGHLHQFLAVADTQAMEVYWVEQLSPSDIKRSSVGGVVPATKESER